MQKRYRFLITAAFLVVVSCAFVYLTVSRNSKLYYEAAGQVTSNNMNNDDIAQSRRNIITETVNQVSPAVVGINVIEIRQYRDPFGSFFDDPLFRQFFGNRGNYNQKVKGLGSGFLISSDGYILTNDHVAGNASEITVTLTNGQHYNARIIGTDPISDICLLKVDGDNLPFIKFGNSDDIIIGEWVIALGNPFGLFDINEQPTVTVGVISAVGMNLEPLNNRYYLNMLQTDAAINGGNSGGPLVNSLGEVIGMNTLIYTAGGAQGNIGLGFAIPVNKVKRIIDELRETGVIKRDFDIGMRVQSIDQQIADYYSLPTARGVLVTQVVKNSPAGQAGLQPGDIIIRIDEYRIHNESVLVGVFQEFRTGQTINLNVVREKENINLKMKLDKK
jgi:serine protease Do